MEDFQSFGTTNETNGNNLTKTEDKVATPTKESAFVKWHTSKEVRLRIPDKDEGVTQEVG